MNKRPGFLPIILLMVVLAVAGCSTASRPQKAEPAPTTKPGTAPATDPKQASDPKSGSSPASGAASGTATPGPSSGSTASGTSGSGSAAKPAASAGNLTIDPLSPGLTGAPAVNTGNVQIRAAVEMDSSAKLSGVGVWLDGQPLAREVLEWDFGGTGRIRYVIRAVPGLLSNGEHSVRIAVSVGTAPAQEARWSFTVERQDTAGTTGAAGTAGTSGTAGTAGTTTPQDGTPLNLYFADSPLVVVGFPAEAGYVTRVQRRVPKTQRPALRAVEELIAGPTAADGEVDRTLPAGTKVLGVTIKDRVAYVNLDESFQTLHPGGTTGGTITAQSLIMTLTEFPTVDRVQVLVGGKPWNDGHFIWDEPLPRLKFEVKRLEVPVIR